MARLAMNESITIESRILYAIWLQINFPDKMNRSGTMKPSKVGWPYYLNGVAARIGPTIYRG